MCSLANVRNIENPPAGANRLAVPLEALSDPRHNLPSGHASNAHEQLLAEFLCNLLGDLAWDTHVSGHAGAALALVELELSEVVALAGASLDLLAGADSGERAFLCTDGYWVRDEGVDVVVCVYVCIKLWECLCVCLCVDRCWEDNRFGGVASMLDGMVV